jgi:hypothetical protein
VFESLPVDGVPSIERHVTVLAPAGAAVGTAVLGPGLGTSVGAKVGGWAEGLFGRKQEKK